MKKYVCIIRYSIYDKQDHGGRELVGELDLQRCRRSAWEDATYLATAPKVIKAYKAKTKQRDIYLRAESAWACLTVASPAIADSSWRIRKGRRYGQRT